MRSILLSKKLVSSLVLILPDYTREFILQTDASKLGFGAVLSQATGEGEKPIAFASS